MAAASLTAATACGEEDVKGKAEDAAKGAAEDAKSKAEDATDGK